MVHAPNHISPPRAVGRRVLALAVAIALCGIADPARADDLKQEAQSGFETGDPGKIVSSSRFIKLLNEKLGARYQDLEIVIKSCYSGEFVTRAKDPQHPLQGNWSMSTAADATHPATTSETDVATPEGLHPGLHQGTHYYQGFAAQWIKKAIDAPTTSNADLFSAAQANDHHPEEGPTYDSSGQVADAMTIHGGKSSNHAVIFSEPAGYGEEITDALYGALKNAGYADADIDMCRDAEAHTGNVTRNAGFSDLLDALDALDAKLREHPGEEKALIFIDAHGSYENRVVAYADAHIPGVPHNGRSVHFPSATVNLAVDSTLLALLKEEAPRAGGGLWADQPALHREAQPYLALTTVAESFQGPATAALSANGHVLGQLALTGGPGGSDYSLALSDSLLDILLTELGGNPGLSIGIELPTPGDSIQLATDDDLAADTSLAVFGYGVRLGAVMDAWDVLTDSTTNVGQTGTEGVTLSRLSPNPVTGSFTYSFWLPRTLRARVQVFDLHGRLLKTLVDGVLPPGQHMMQWNHVHDAGGLPGPGTYLLRLEAGGVSRTKRFVVLR